MLGTDSEPGIMVLTLNDLFKQMGQDQHVMKYRATIAYLEVTTDYFTTKSKISPHFMLTLGALYFTPSIGGH